MTEFVYSIPDDSSSAACKYSLQFTFKSVATSFFVSFQYITESGISPNISGILNIILSLIAQLVLITAIILLRKKRRTFIVLLFFMVFYMVLIGVICQAR